MEILTHKRIYQLVGDSASGSNECITKSEAMEIANAHRKNITSSLSLYGNSECIDVFAVEDMEDLSKLKFANNTFNVAADAIARTTTATSLDIDGNTIEYTATADVDWITDITISGTAIVFQVANNTGGQRVGHITGVNSASKSDTITVTQEAYVAPLKCVYKLIAKGAESIPTITINGESFTPVLDGDNYIYEYTVRVANISDAPASVPFTIRNGGTKVWIENPSITVSPTSWDLKDSLIKDFTVSYSDTLYQKKWNAESGTIARDSSTTTTLTTYSQQETPTVSYSVSDNAASGSSFVYTKSGMKLSAKASDTGCAPSTITIGYNGAQCAIGVICTPDKYKIKWADGTSSKTKSVGSNGGSFQDTVVTTINDEEYTDGSVSVSSSVSWISATVSGRSITISYEQNSGDSDRSGVVTIKDSEDNSITYTIRQSYNSWSHEYTLVATGAGSRPTITINGQSVTPTLNGNAYTAVYTATGTGTDTAPSSVSWSISGGVPANSWGAYNVSVTPTSWNLADGLSESFTVSLVQSGTQYSWGTTSGTIVKDGTSSTAIEGVATSRNGSSYSVSCPDSVTATKNDMSFTATAASSSNTGAIVVTCTESDANGENFSIKVYYDQTDYLVWKSYISPSTLYFGYSADSKSVTMYTWQEWAIAGTIYGGVKNAYKETITCYENQTSVTNVWTKSFTHDGMTETVSCIQAANSIAYSSSINPSSMTFTWEGGSQTATMKTWWWWHGSDTQHHDEKSYDCVVTVSKNESGGSGSEPFTHDGVTQYVSWTQSARPAETWGDWTYVFSGTAGTVSYSWDCVKGSTGSDSIQSYRTRTSSWGNTSKEDVAYSESDGSGPTSNNTTSSAKTGTYSTLTQSGSNKKITRSWSQAVKPTESKTGPYYAWVTDGNFSFGTAGGTLKKNYVQYYKQGSTIVDKTTLEYSITKGILYSTTDSSGSEAVGTTGLTASWTQTKNSKEANSSLTRKSGTGNLSYSAGTVTLAYNCYVRWVVNDGSNIASDSYNKSFSYVENTNTITKDLTFKESHAALGGVAIPDASCTLTQDAKPSSQKTTVTVSVSVRAQAAGDGTILITGTLSQSVPFAFSVTGVCDFTVDGVRYDEGSGYGYTLSFSANSTRTTYSITVPGSGIASNATARSNISSIDEKTVGDTTYKIST